MSKQSFTTGQVLTAAQVNSLQANDYNQTVSVKTASYVLVAADKGTRIEFNTSGSVTCTVNSGLFDAGDTLVIQNRGAGAVTVTAGTATVNTSATLVLSQYDAGTLYFISASAAIFFNTDAGGGSPLTTKGDLYGFSTLDARIPIGANNTVLTADSNEALGLKWAAPAGGGKVLQVVQVETSTSTSVTSATFTDSGLSGSITPSSASSKILVMTMQPIAISRTSNPVSARFRLLRGATTIWDGNGSGGGGFRVFAQAVTNDGLDLNALQNINYLDSPATTSSVTYKTQMRVQTASDSETVTAQAAGRPSTIILMEIGA